MMHSTGPMSTAHSHPPPMGGMVGHPSVISTSRPLPSPMSALGSPMNGLASPYPVITSSLGSPSISLPSTPNMNFGLSSPQRLIFVQITTLARSICVKLSSLVDHVPFIPGISDRGQEVEGHM
eukprot:superscaffoldBa00000465_g4930